MSERIDRDEAARRLFDWCERYVRDHAVKFTAMGRDMGVKLGHHEAFRSGVYAGFFAAIDGVLTGEIDIKQISESTLSEACGPEGSRIG